MSYTAAGDAAAVSLEVAMKCGNCGFDFGGDRQMIILIPSQIVRCPQCGKLIWPGDGDDLDSFGTVCHAEEDDKDEPV